MRKSRKISKKRIIILVIIFIVLLFVLFNVKIIFEAKKADEGKSGNITFPYDEINNWKDSDNVKQRLVCSENTAESVKKNAEGGYFVEFPNTYFGTIKIKLHEAVQKDTKVKIIIGEAREGDQVWTKEYGPIDGYGYGANYYSDEISVEKGSKEIFLQIPERTRPDKSLLPENWNGGVSPFCYAEVYGIEQMLDKENFIQFGVYYPFDDTKSAFSSDNGTLNDVYVLCKNTIKTTTYPGIFVDGYRELAPYEADAYINELSYTSVENDPTIVKASLDAILEHHSWPTEWIYQTIYYAYDYYLYTGDVEYLREIYPELKICLMQLLVNQSGLIDSSLEDVNLTNSLGVGENSIRDIIDWPDNDDFDKVRSVSKKNYFSLSVKGWYYNYCAFVSRLFGFDYSGYLYSETAGGLLGQRYTFATPNAVVNAYYYQALKDMSDIARLVGNEEDSKEYSNEAKNFYDIYQESYLGQNGLYVDSIGSKHSSFQTNLFALAFGLVKDENVSKVVDFLKSEDMNCSTYASEYLLTGLCQSGNSEYAIELMSSKTNRSWWYMMNGTGSKLCTEAWNSKEKPNQDWNHAWSTAPLNVITRYIDGIRIENKKIDDEQKDRLIVIDPKFDGLNEVSAKVPIKKGSISLNYKKNDNLKNLELDVEVSERVALTISDENNTLIDGQDASQIGLHFDNDGNEYVFLERGRHVVEER